jgi:hypothetical protein
MVFTSTFSALPFPVGKLYAAYVFTPKFRVTCHVSSLHRGNGKAAWPCFTTSVHAGGRKEERRQEREEGVQPHFDWGFRIGITKAVSYCTFYAEVQDTTERVDEVGKRRS